MRAAEEEETEDGGLVAAEPEGIADAVLVFGDAVTGDVLSEAEFFEGAEGFADVGLGEVHDGVAAGFLIAGVDDGVEGERIVLGSDDLFFDESAEDAGLDGGEVHGDSIAN